MAGKSGPIRSVSQKGRSGSRGFNRLPYRQPRQIPDTQCARTILGIIDHVGRLCDSKRVNPRQSVKARRGALCPLPLLYWSHLWRCAAAEPSPLCRKVPSSSDPENYLRNKRQAKIWVSNVVSEPLLKKKKKKSSFNKHVISQSISVEMVRLTPPKYFVIHISFLF